MTSLLAVLDSAALYLSLCPEAAPAVPARLCLRAGLVCFGEVEFPVEREPEAAWPHFVGWRVNYEQAAYALAAVDAVPALWSGPRRRPATPMPPLRPGPGAPPL